jgi:uncharacterized protein
MPSALTYPGVYIEEIPSGVRTITGVSTSVTAFVGSGKRGPINRAVHLLSFADFERAFGGLQVGAELGYAVRQFFQNGGADAYAVRIAKNALAATRTLQDASANVLALTALDEGKSGNRIEVRVDYATANPASTFNLTFEQTDPDDPGATRRETFSDLSMNSNDPRYVVDALADSELVSAKRVDAALASIAAAKGTSVSGVLEDDSGNVLDVATLVDATHNELQVSVNGAPPVRVVIDVPADVTGATENTRLDKLCAAIATKVQGQLGAGTFSCSRAGHTIVMQSETTPGEASSVRALPGVRNDATARLKLGTPNGGVETDATAALRPVEIPAHGTLRSGTFANTDLDGLPSPTHNALQIGLDTFGPDPVLLDLPAFAAGGNLNTKLDTLAAHLQTKVRALKPANPAYSGFTGVRDGANRLLLSSGSRGLGSSVQISPAAANSIAQELHLLAEATADRPLNATLQNGNEDPYTAADVYNLIIADRATRKGLYALDSVDIFNLLCLPGVSDGGVLADAVAYCRERRAFLIVDPPAATDTLDEIVKLSAGASLPKSDHAAIYYPWVKISDPLRSGKLRPTPPSGTIAGLYARTDGSRGIWKAPAGTEAVLGGVQGVVGLPLTDGESGVLNPKGVNAIRLFPVVGAVAWGARTLRGADQLADEYKYVPIRRLALFIEESLYRGTQWAVFEPNDEPLWAQLRLNIGAFMQNLFRQGAFQGRTPAQAFLVKCDSETTTQNDINLGVVNILVAFAPLKPAEFVVIRIQQKAGQIEA